MFLKFGLLWLESSFFGAGRPLMVEASARRETMVVNEGILKIVDLSVAGI